MPVRLRSVRVGAVFAVLSALIVPLHFTTTPASAHRSGCHRWHSCPSDTGSYECGDLGYDTYCPDKNEPSNTAPLPVPAPAPIQAQPVPAPAPIQAQPVPAPAPIQAQPVPAPVPVQALPLPASLPAESSAPVSAPGQQGALCFNIPAITSCIQGRFREFWEQNGGLPILGYPITAAAEEQTAEGMFLTEYFERNRFEFHPEKQAPYDVLLGRLGDVRLKQLGRDWTTFPKVPSNTPHFFGETGHAISHTPFWEYWSTHGLQDPSLDPFGRSLALFGIPLSEPSIETNGNGDTVLTQWFERARFEDHGAKGVLLGLLGNEVRVGSRVPSNVVPEPIPSNQAPLPMQQPAGLLSANVVRVVDGDTVDVVVSGKPERLRLIGIDTPEVVDPRKPVQCFGREASAKAHELLDGKIVFLEADQSQDERDTYDRLLRYIWLPDGRLFNLEIVKQGYAHEYTYSAPYKYQSQFKQAEQEASDADRGLWSPSTCNGDTEQPADRASSPPAPPTPTSIAQSTGNNCDPSYPTLCIPASSPDLNCPDIPQRRFPVVGADRHRFDGDGDGIGCES